MKLRATVEQNDKTATGIEIPEEVVTALGSSKRPAVKVTVNDRHTYRSTVTPMGGRWMLPLSAENRTAAGVAGGDEVDLELELDTEPREVTVPIALAEALDGDPEAKGTFERLSYSRKLWHVLQVDGAKTDETRQRRIAKSLEMLRDGRG